MKRRIQYFEMLKKEFRGYNFSTFRKDLMAGITVTAVALPLALAFGLGSGATAQAGLITAVIAGLVIGAFSGGSFQISGPTGAMAVILVPLSMKFGLNGIFAAGIIAGVILIIAAALNLGKIVSIIPAPVITGFTSGIAILIILGQAGNFFGVASGEGENTVVKLWNTFAHGFAPNWWAVGLALATILIVVIFPKKWGKVFPPSLLAIIVVTAAAVIFKMPVPDIGEIPQTLFPKERLNFAAIDWALLSAVAAPAISIALLSMIESLLCGEVGSRMAKSKFHTRQELIAQGIGNIIIPIFGGIPATAAIARTSVAVKSGGRTRLVSIIHAVGLLLAIFLLAPLMARIPLSVLAGILIVVAFKMNEWHSIKFFFSKKMLFAISSYIVTMAVTVAFDLTVAILVGVCFSAVLFILQLYQDTKIEVTSVDEEKFAKRITGQIKKSLDYIKVIYLSGPIFFTTMNKVSDKLVNNVGNAHVVILSMRGVPSIDTSGIMGFYNLLEDLNAKSCRLLLAGVQQQVFTKLKSSGFIDKMNESMVFWDAEKAIFYAQDFEGPIPSMLPAPVVPKVKVKKAE